MVKINKKKCTACGICISICHESCMSIVDKKIFIDYKFCSSCTQCIAVCSAAALLWNNVNPIAFNKKILPTSVQLEELFKERRTDRFFKDKKIEKRTIEEIVNYGIYAPAHSYDFRAVILKDKKIIEAIDREMLIYINWIYRVFFKPKIISFMLKFLPSVFKEEYLKGKPKLEKSIKLKKAYISKPPVMILLIADKRIPLALESAQYALYNIDLFARTKGLGCRNLVGNQMFLNKNRKIKSLLGLRKNEKIFGTIGLGYTEKIFKNKVEGKKINYSWL